MVKYMLHITWQVPDLPANVGPFETREDANAWAELNIPNGSWEVWPLVWPYKTAP